MVKESCLSKGVQKCGYHICVLGLIGSGKTTTTKCLEQVIKDSDGECMGLYEPVEENPLLKLYYQEPDKYAFPMQIAMLNRRFEQQILAQDLAFDGISSVQDSSIFGDSCFVEMLRKSGTLSEELVNVYSELFANMARYVMYPSLVVYLNCEPDVCMKRIAKRGRECEKDIPVEYLRALKAELDDLIEDFGRYTFIKIVNANADMNHDEIMELARNIYHEAKMMRNHPVISRMGV